MPTAVGSGLRHHQVVLVVPISVEDVDDERAVEIVIAREVCQAMAFVRGLRTDHIPSHERRRRFVANHVLSRQRVVVVVVVVVVRNLRLDRPRTVPQQK
jgi:hypothetical protein